MTDVRYDRARAKFRRLLPPPPPNSGWLYALGRIAAQALGVQADDRASAAETQLLLGAKQSRTDAFPTDWTVPENQWAWGITSEIGASDLWLDHWGRILNVPRIPGEQDPIYAIRILSEVTHPGTVNLGMAQCIDDVLGAVGTVVIESVDYYKINHFNQGLHCGSGVHANSGADLNGVSAWATFIVLLPPPITPRMRDIVASIVSRKKAAGTRLYRTYILTAAFYPVTHYPWISSDWISRVWIT